LILGQIRAFIYIAIFYKKSVSICTPQCILNAVVKDMYLRRTWGWLRM